MKQPQLNGEIQYPDNDLQSKYDKLLATCARQVDEIIKLKEACRKVRLEIGTLEHNWDYHAKNFMPDIIEVLKSL